MPQNFFITGLPKAGKTTLLRKLVEKLKKKGLKVGGFISPEEKHHGTRTAFHVRDIETEKEGMLASVDGDGPKVSKYHVDIRSFESIALPSMQKCDKYDVFVIDELGRMEMKSKKFIWALDKVLDSETPLVVSLHKDYVEKYSVAGEVFEVTSDNHEAVLLQVLRRTTGLMKKPAKKKAAPKKKKAAGKKKTVKKKAAPKKAAKKKPTKKTKKEKPTRDERPPHKEAKEKAMKELEEEHEEEKGFFGKVKNALGL